MISSKKQDKEPLWVKRLCQNSFAKKYKYVYVEICNADSGWRVWSCKSLLGKPTKKFYSQRAILMLEGPAGLPDGMWDFIVKGSVYSNTPLEEERDEEDEVGSTTLD